AREPLSKIETVLKLCRGGLPIHAMARMLEQRRRGTHGGVARLSVATLCALAACAGELRQEHTPPVLASWSRALGDCADVVFLPAPAHGDAHVPREAGLVIVDPEWRLPERTWSALQCRSLRRFVDGGGRIVLFGHAAQL